MRVILTIIFYIMFLKLGFDMRNSITISELSRYCSRINQSVLCRPSSTCVTSARVLCNSEFWYQAPLEQCSFFVDICFVLLVFLNSVPEPHQSKKQE